MGAEIIISKNNVELNYWCRNSYVFKAFDYAGAIKYDDKSHTLTRDHFEQAINYIEDLINERKENIKRNKIILQGLNSYQERFDCLEIIKDNKEELKMLKYALNTLYVYDSIRSYLTNEGTLEIYCSY
jgi:hypothetical protein